MVFGALSAAYLNDGMTLETLHGSTLPVAIADSVVRVGGTAVTVPDIGAANEVIHIVDTVLVPDDPLPLTETSGATIASWSRPPSLAPVIGQRRGRGLEGTLGEDGPFTVFAPAEIAYALPPENWIALS